jgi:hypothetical protein
MKSKLVLSGLMALALSTLTVKAWTVCGVVACPNGTSTAGIVVLIDGGPSTTTDDNGAFCIDLPDTPATYNLCVDTSTLPSGTTVCDNTRCVNFSVDENNMFPNVNFTLCGSICAPPVAKCWLTGGGTIKLSGKGKPTFSYGGVVNPGCSPTAAGGGNWNVVDHRDGLHFKGLTIRVIGCSGVPTKSPKSSVNIIDFEGEGVLISQGGGATVVCFRARAIDNSEPGHGSDMLYLRVFDCSTGTTLMLISADTGDPTDIAPLTVSTGNLQIHQNPCGKK